tara:strand:+ start:374 stop:1132 length:759 start_codon:yes stop_codon:yes gene_type:complete
MKTIKKALVILNQFSNARPVWGVTELSAATGINKSIVHKILASLIEGDLIARDPENRRYRLGSGIVRLAGRHLSNLQPLEIARPHLFRLWEETAETIHYTISNKGVNLIVQVYESPQSLRVSAHLGETGSYHGTAAGKVFLAFGNIQTKSQIFASPLEKHTPKTIADKNQLEAEIDQVRQDGFATSQEELEIGFCALSAPVIDPAGNMLGAVTVAIPVSRFNEKNVQHCRSLLFQATHKIMEEFGTDFSLRS